MDIAAFVPLSVSPIDSLSDEINKVRLDTAQIVAEQIIPNEELLGNYEDPRRDAFVYEIKNLIREAGLWAPHLPREYGGMGIGFLGHAYMNEILAWSPYSNPLFGVVAPNSGNESLLVKYDRGTEKTVAGTPDSWRASVVFLDD